MRRYLVPAVATSGAVGLALLVFGSGTVLQAPVATAFAPPEPERIAARYPVNQAYSAWRGVGVEGCPRLEDVSDLAAGDVDGDDVLEIVFGSLEIQDSYGLHVMRRKVQDGSWGCPEALSVSQPVTRVAIVSLEPGSPAVVAATRCEGLPCLLKIEATPGSVPSVLYQLPAAAERTQATDFRVADLDQDGVLDIAIVFANLKNPSEALAPVILKGRLERDAQTSRDTWRGSDGVLETKISHSFAVEIGVFSSDGRAAVLFGGVGEGCQHSVRERQPVGILALRKGASWQTTELETEASGESDEPRWIIDFALGTTGAEIGLATAHSHCPGGDATKPFGCTPDSRPELKVTSLEAHVTPPRLLAPERGEWKALAYLGPSRWALGFVETERYLVGGKTKFRAARGGVLLVDENGTEPTSRIPGPPFAVQDITAISLRPRGEQEPMRVAAREGTQITAYPLTFAPSLSCDGKPTHADTMTWVPESRLVTIPKLPSPCPNAELTYLADKRPALVALDRTVDGVFISESVN